MSVPWAVVVGLAVAVGNCVPAPKAQSGAAHPALAPVAGDAGPAVPADPGEPAAGATTVEVGFAADVQPILAARCQPCHFEGGKMYAELPFDRAATVHELGTRLFSRIKDPAEQATLRAFLAQASR